MDGGGGRRSLGAHQSRQVKFPLYPLNVTHVPSSLPKSQGAKRASPSVATSATTKRQRK